MTTREIVIIGGGIIGCTTAYYLTRHPSVIASPESTKITLLEASINGPAQGASGKAGGLVARWAYPQEIVDVSFNEHVKLAEEHNGKDRWGWRYVGCGSWEGRSQEALPPEENEGNKSLEKTLGLPGSTKPLQNKKLRKANGLPADLLWVDKDLTDAYSRMAREGDTAQVHPYLFTTSMFQLAKEKGLNYVNGRVTAINKKAGSVTGISYINLSTKSTETISATQVLLCAGAWSTSIESELPIEATRAHSITIRPKPNVEIAPYVLFTEIEDLSFHSRSSPEIYARPDNEVYACGPGDNYPLPETVDEVVVDGMSCDLIYKHVSSISKELREGTIEKRQACYLPSVSTGSGPIIGEAPRIAKGLYIGTGHTCWGISNAPGTARALSELILDGKIKCANLRKLSPTVLL